MKKFMMSACALSFLGAMAAGVGTANATATEVETVTVTGRPIVAISENPSRPTSYRALQRERLAYYKTNGTPRKNSYAAEVLRGCYWDEQRSACVHFN